MKNSKNLLIVAVLGIVVLSGCGKKTIKVEGDTEQSSDVITEENNQVENVQETENGEKIDTEKDVQNTTNVTEQPVKISDEDELSSDNLSDSSNESDIEENDEDEDSDSETDSEGDSDDDDDECVNSGGVHSGITGGCYYAGDESTDNSIADNETDDPKAQKCIDEGGSYNSGLETCYK